jgi:hypothetical protein
MAGRGMNAAAAAATPSCRVNPSGTAPPARRKRPVRGAERQYSEERNAGENRERSADAAYARRGSAALELSLHDILLQSLQSAIWSAR